MWSRGAGAVRLCRYVWRTLWTRSKPVCAHVRARTHTLACPTSRNAGSRQITVEDVGCRYFLHSQVLTPGPSYLWGQLDCLDTHAFICQKYAALPPLNQPSQPPPPTYAYPAPAGVAAMKYTSAGTDYFFFNQRLVSGKTLESFHAPVCVTMLQWRSVSGFRVLMRMHADSSWCAWHRSRQDVACGTCPVNRGARGDWYVMYFVCCHCPMHAELQGGRGGLCC